MRSKNLRCLDCLEHIVKQLLVVVILCESVILEMSKTKMLKNYRSTMVNRGKKFCGNRNLRNNYINIQYRYK